MTKRVRKIIGYTWAIVSILVVVAMILTLAPPGGSF